MLVPCLSSTAKKSEDNIKICQELHWNLSPSYLKGQWKGNEKCEKNNSGRKHTICQKHKKATKIENYKFSTKDHTNNKQEKVTSIAAVKSLLS
jgi:hypothetical protein